MKIKIKSIVTALALSASLSAFAADTIRIGVSGPYTGGSSPMGVSMRDGVRLAATEINA
jgi:branched-chain amino acid transport system substrate-binding protein